MCTAKPISSETCPCARYADPDPAAHRSFTHTRSNTGAYTGGKHTHAHRQKEREREKKTLLCNVIYIWFPFEI